MKKLVFILIIGFGFFQWYSGASNNKVVSGNYGETHDKLIMYSLTTCGYCKKKVKEFNAEGIPFTEYFIDKDSARREELNAKLTKAGLPPRRYGTPIFDVKGVMMPNNPPLAEIKKYL